MKRVLLFNKNLLTVTVFFFASLFLLVGCFEGVAGREGKVLRKYLNPEDLKALIDNAVEKPDDEYDAIYDPEDTEFEYPIWIVDTRDAIQYAFGHIPKAKNFTYPGLALRLDEIPKEVYLIVHCETGGRAQLATNVLCLNGYKRWMNWGGIVTWPYDLVKGQDPE